MLRWFSAGILALGMMAVVCPVSATTLANSVADFSGTQGNKGWLYGYYATDAPDSFTQASEFDSSNGMWYEDSTNYWLCLWMIGAHPEGVDDAPVKTSTDQWAVRRWVSDFTGSVTITGKLNKFVDGGDGTLDSIFVNGVSLFSQLVTTTDMDMYSLTVDLNEGDTVDFVTSPVGNDLYDATHFTALITTPTPEPSTVLYLAPCLVGLAWLLRRRRRA
ncbi:MAG TPA: hypothetical protein VG675_21625 [Bryobacteraceae bacterium]|nr:hypothetical protein [Bryobacteraceae bacterium]